MDINILSTTNRVADSGPIPDLFDTRRKHIESVALYPTIKKHKEQLLCVSFCAE